MKTRTTLRLRSDDVRAGDLTVEPMLDVDGRPVVLVRIRGDAGRRVRMFFADPWAAHVMSRELEEAAQTAVLMVAGPSCPRVH
jgi:hypothetical protein